MGTRQIAIPGGETTYTGSENWGGAASGGSDERTGQILDTDVSYYIDGSVESPGDGLSPAAAWDWFGPLADALKDFVRIDAMVRVNVIGTTPVEFWPLTLPAFGPNGKLVIVGEERTSVADFVADAGSTQLHLLREMAFMSDDWSGYTIECTIGNNVGYRRTIARVQFGETDVITPSVMWPFDPVGDTFYVSRPASLIEWLTDPGDVPRMLRGGGGTVQPYSATQNGVWISNVVIAGECAIGAGCVANFVGVEVRDGAMNNACVQAHEDAMIIAGACVTAAPWINQSVFEPIWEGWGIQQPAIESNPAVSVARRAWLEGTVCGVSAAISGGAAKLTAGCLRGSASLAGLSATDGARVVCENTSILSTAANVVHCDGAQVSLRGNLEHQIASALPTDTDYASSTILRATAGGVINVSEGNGMIGITYGVAQDASGGGVIRWNGPPTLQSFVTGSALLVDGFKADNIELEHAVSTFRGGSQLSRIERYGVPSMRFREPYDRWVRVTDFVVHVNNGPAVEVMPEPPAGYVWVFQALRATNNDAAAMPGGPGSWLRLFDVDGVLHTTTGTVPGDGASGNGTGTSVSAAIVSRSAVTAQCAGAGPAGATFGGIAFLVPAPPIFVVAPINSQVWTPVPGVAPTEPGVRAVPWLAGQHWDQTSATSTPAISHTDTVAAQGFQMRVRRGSNTVVMPQAALITTPNGARLQPTIFGLALKQGDVFEVRLRDPPNAINTTFIRMYLELVPEL